MVKEFPFTGVLSLIGIVLVLVFFITSSDSGSLVIDTITAGGKTDAPVSQRVFWCSFERRCCGSFIIGRRCRSVVSTSGHDGIYRITIYPCITVDVCEYLEGTQRGQ